MTRSSCKLYTFDNQFAWGFFFSECSLLSHGQAKKCLHGGGGAQEPSLGLGVGNPNGLFSCSKQTWGTCQTVAFAPFTEGPAWVGCPPLGHVLLSDGAVGPPRNCNLSPQQGLFSLMPLLCPLQLWQISAGCEGNEGSQTSRQQSFLPQ